MKELSILLLILIISSCENSSSTLPNELAFIEDYHCWPYNVEVYTVENLKTDNHIVEYPLDNFCSGSDKVFQTKWVKFKNLDTAVQNGYISMLSKCDDHSGLHDQIIKGNEIYFAGCYKYGKNRENDKVKFYYDITFLDVNEKELHVLEYINYIY